jgi:hypothetical protein
MAIQKPPVVPIWADNATTSPDLVQPNDAEIQTGWPAGTSKPARGRFNWILKFCANAVRYFSRRGLVDYDAAETYMTGDIVRGDDGLIYRSKVDTNLNHTPSTSATQWGSPLAPTPAVDDNSTKIATTAYVLAQVSVTLPAMNGTASVGSGNRFALSNHVHPSDTSKANTSGTYAGLNVGFATSAGSVPFSGVTGKPTSCAGYGITDAITTVTIGSQSVAFATSAGRAFPKRSDGTAIDINWTGLGGQPNWLVGSNDGVNFYVFNPSNFSVNFATSASQSTTQARGTSNNLIATTNFACPGFSHGGSGYDQLPSGLILQWVWTYVGDVSGNYFNSVSWPVTFPTACFAVQATLRLNSGSETDASVTTFAEDQTGCSFTVQEWSGTVQDFYVVFFAIGK